MAIAVTVGEPAGIGGEIALKAWLLRREENLPAFFLIGCPRYLRSVSASLDLAVPIAEIAEPQDAPACFDNALPVLPLSLPARPIPGTPAAANARAVIESIDRAASLALSQAVDGIVTLPINKAILYRSGFGFPGHTEYLAHLTKAAGSPIMMLVGGGLRVVPVTIHEPLAQAIARLDGPLIETTARRVAQALRSDFGIAAPRLALAGLNPHAGEQGALGDEEVRFIAPAAARLRRAGIDVSGPHAPDSMFHAAARAGYDAAICLYHDQALIPLKTLAFHEGVNATLGLPIVRTSPDHGTALDIAGKGRANPSSLCASLRLAQSIGVHRARF